MYRICRIEVPQPALLKASPFDLFTSDPEDVERIFSDPEEDVERMFSGSMELDLGTSFPPWQIFRSLLLSQSKKFSSFYLSNYLN
jgi:hypothetical protein